MSTNNGHGPLVILDAVRTPFTKAGGELAQVPAEELGRVVSREILDRTGIDRSSLDQVVFGCVGQNSKAANIARVIALRAGVPDSVPAMTVHRNCASGMEAITQSMMHCHAGRGSLFLVGGTESMSDYPLIFGRKMTKLFQRLSRARSIGAKLSSMLSFRPSFLAPRVALIEGLRDPTCGLNMGQTAELLAREHGHDRDAQDAYALASHQKAAVAAERLKEEMVVVADGRGGAVMHDSSVRPEQSLEALGKLRPVFEKHYGSVTAGNACPVTDGAVALLVSSEARAESTGVEPLGRVIDYAYVALEPSRMGLGPVYAINSLLERTGLSIDDIDLFEINEAFAAQVLACLSAASSDEFGRNQLGRSDALGAIPADKLNVNGGAIALGHAVGATGARLVLTMLKELKRRGLKRGIASLCIGGGQGAALLLEV